ncbi:hypothetical protein [Phytohabitans kaempferiae]|uniref:DUF2637 domain-containing protein n=1 Tax=Phytohabitans kaempferiae TaxID=1620943 RepID=A0ABV6MEI2_9ACTN
MSSTTTNRPTRAQRFEGIVLVLIVLVVGIAAGAASFTHVHDWTMDNSPAGTPGWFGWANAVISELVPIAALLTIRRRKRTGGSIFYPMALLVAAALLSLAAQLGVAVGHVGPSGWLLSAVPALAFMALVKLVLAPVKTSTPDTPTVEPAAPALDTPAAMPSVDPEPASTPAASPTPMQVSVSEVPTHLLPTARYAVVNHRQTHNRPISANELAARLSIGPDTAAQLLAELGEPTTPALPARVNGTPINGGRP